MPLTLKITQLGKGPTLNLVVVMTSQNSDSNESVISEIFEIADLVMVRLKLALSITDENVHVVSISTMKHTLVQDPAVKMFVTCDEYSREWSCTEKWTDWIDIGQITADKIFELKNDDAAASKVIADDDDVIEIPTQTNEVLEIDDDDDDDDVIEIPTQPNEVIEIHDDDEINDGQINNDDAAASKVNTGQTNETDKITDDDDVIEITTQTIEVIDDDDEINNGQTNKAVYLSTTEISISVQKICSSAFIKLYADSDMTDYSLKTIGGSVAVHRAVLAVHSDVFKRMITEERNTNFIRIDGHSLQTVQHLKDFLYLGTLPDHGLRLLLDLASQYAVNDLVEEGAWKLAETALPEDLYSVHEFACAQNIPELSYALKMRLMI